MSSTQEDQSPSAPPKSSDEMKINLEQQDLDQDGQSSPTPLIQVNNSCAKHAKIVCGVFFVIVLVFLTIRPFFMFVGVEKDKNLCRSLDCIQASLDLKSHLDETFNPCDNFWKFACQGWVQEYSSKVETGENSTQVFTELEKRNSQLITKLLNNSKSSNSEAESKAKKFYSSCVAEINLFDIFGDEDYDTNTDEYDYLIKNDEWKWQKYFSQEIRTLVEDTSLTELKDSVCSIRTRELFPEVIARLFVSEGFLSYQDQVLSIIEHTLSTYQEMIQNISWIDKTTSSYLHTAFKEIDMVVGYPKEIMDVSYVDSLYRKVTVTDSYQQNLLLLSLIRSKNPAGPEVGRTINVNAGYTQIYDKIFFSAGILQFPLFGTFPDVLNFAKFATTVAHELTHALQDYINGIDLEVVTIPPSKLVSNLTRVKFEELYDCAIDQYNKLQVPFQFKTRSKLMINGRSTVQENVADILGIQVAFKSFMVLGSSYIPLPGLEKFTKEQLFFIAAAQNQCEYFPSQKAEAAMLKEQIKTDTHSPHSIRVLGQMQNFDEFAKAFDCPIGAHYNPTKKCNFFE